MPIRFTVLFFLFFFLSQDDSVVTGSDVEHSKSLQLASWRWEEYRTPIMFTGLLAIAVVLKIIFHHMPWLARLLPESCVLILVGINFGIILNYVEGVAVPEFTAEIFFHFLLPPIILDSAIALYDDAFLDNFMSILVFAILGTLFNTFCIGYSMFGLAQTGVLGTFQHWNSTENITITENISATECLIFSSLISAVDPVAVLAIFEDIHVNVGLYFMVFGESLLNDGVTVVLYNTMIALVDINYVGAEQIAIAFFSFFCVVLGGAVLGLVFGLLSSLVTLHTRHVRVVEPLAIFSLGYNAFLAAELVHWSGIISIITYGITVKRYAFQNISKKSYTTVKYALKTMASVSDCVIFIFLGLELIKRKHCWHLGFILATIILCLVFRFLSVFLFGSLVNIRRKEKIELNEQFIMAIGGLRGAVGFSLAEVISDKVWYRDLFITTALVMVIFTVFLQGGTIKTFVKLFHIKLAASDKKKNVSDLVQKKLVHHMMDGIVSITGSHWKSNAVNRVLTAADQGLKNCLIKKDSKDMMERTMEKIMVEEHINNLYAPTIHAHKITRRDNIPAEKIKRCTWKALEDHGYKPDKIEREKKREYVRRNITSLQINIDGTDQLLENQSLSTTTDVQRLKNYYNAVQQFKRISEKP